MVTPSAVMVTIARKRLRLPRTSPFEAKAISGVEPDWSKVLVFDESGRRVRLNAEATAERVFNVEMRSEA